jgi:hypothetical protein
VVCYASDGSYKAQEETGYRLAGLVLREKFKPGSVGVDEWLSVYSGVDDRWIEEAALADIIVSDGYHWAVAAAEALGEGVVYYVEKLLPTPLDLLSMASRGRLPRRLVLRLSRFIVEYVEHIVSSVDLTEAYDKIVSDPDYVRLVEDAVSDHLRLEFRHVAELLSRPRSPGIRDPNSPSRPEVL